MTTSYYRAPADRSLARKLLDTSWAYIRVDLQEERMFPLANVMRFVGIVFPVVLYYFQVSFLHLSQSTFGFMVIGLAVGGGLSDALVGLTMRLQYATERGTLETYLVEPIPWTVIPIAMNVYRSVLGFALAVVMYFVGWLAGAPCNPRGIPAALLLLLLGIIACNAVGALFSSFLLLFKRGDPLIAIYTWGAAIVGGSIFPISVLPPGIRWVGYLIPHMYVTAGVRELLLPDAPPGGASVPLCFLVVSIFCVVGTALGLRLFNRSLLLARRLGTLAI